MSLTASTCTTGPHTHCSSDAHLVTSSPHISTTRSSSYLFRLHRFSATKLSTQLAVS